MFRTMPFIYYTIEAEHLSANNVDIGVYFGKEFTQESKELVHQF